MTENSDQSYHQFLLIWLGQFITAIGSGLSAFGLGVYIFRQTQSASAMALVTLLGFVPALLLSAAAGVLGMMNGGAKLWQICVGVTISSVFSSLSEPAFKATITDLLTPQQYTRASGLVGIASSAKYLISPVIAGLLLAVSDIKLLLMIDICTFFVTVMVTQAVKSSACHNGCCSHAVSRINTNALRTDDTCFSG